MAGAVLDRQLAGAGRSASRVCFGLATEADEAALRQLLRAAPMQGAIRLTLEREPDYFRGCNIAGAMDQALLARENGRIICAGRCSTRSRFVNGRLARVGYLGELRLDASAQGRFDVLRRGYQYFRQLQEQNPPATWFTSIAADNHRSIRFLERGLPGMPRYQFRGGLVTLLIPVPRRGGKLSRLESRAQAAFCARGFRCERGSPESVATIAALLAATGSRFQFASGWTAQEMESLARWNLSLHDWLCVFRGRELVACAALWDQRGFRQVVLRGFAPSVMMARPLVNLASWFSGLPGIPSTGSVLAQGFLSPLAVAPEQEEVFVPLIEWALTQAGQRRLNYLTLGLPAGDPRLRMVQTRFRCRAYESRLYQVGWPDQEPDVTLDARPVLPEVALL